jgi:ATP-dependent helicase/DNAse subunit B
MALKLVLGPAGAGKAGVILTAYRDAASRGALLVVPTAADATHYERELCADGPLAGRALTFASLFEEMALRAGYSATAVTATQRERLLRRMLADSELHELAPVAGAPGFVRALGRLIGDLRQARVAPARLSRAVGTVAEQRQREDGPLRELAGLYRRYDAMLSGRGLLDGEEFGWNVLTRLREAPGRFGRSPVFLYGFDDFTALELDAITTLAEHVGTDVNVSLTYEAGRLALAARAGVVEDLREHVSDEQVLPARDEYYDAGSRAALHHLERTIFEPEAPVRDPDAAIALIEAAGERTEADAIAELVAGRLASGLPAEEIVVVCRSLSRSGALLEHALARRGVAVSSGRRVALRQLAFGRGLMALLRLAGAGRELSVVDVLGYLRSPVTSASRADVDRLEVSLRRRGISTLALDDLSPARGAGLGELRHEIMRLREPGSLVRTLAFTVTRLLAATHRHDAGLFVAGEREDAQAAAATLAASRAGDGIERTLADLLDLLDGVMVAVGEPPAAGRVLIAEPLAIRARRFRHVIVSGLNEGEFPSLAGGDGAILGDDRRRELAQDAGVVLAGAEDRLARERYLLYAVLSRATERITISYRSCDEEGAALSPSPFLDDLEAVLGGEWRERREQVTAARFIPARPAVDHAAIGVTADDAAIRVTAHDAAVGVTADEAAIRVTAHDAAVGVTADPRVATADPSAATAERMRTLAVAALASVQGGRLLSASALEAYARCPVRWLVEQQLRLHDLEPDPEALARGSFIHAVLERVLRGVGGAITLRNFANAETELTAALAESDDDPSPGSPPEVRAALVRGIEADLRRFIRHEAETGNGWPAAQLELRFGAGDEDGAPPLQLGDDDGDSVELAGRIDRVDVEAGGRRAIVRDYKSGRHRSDWGGTAWLANDHLQVGLYMLAAQRLLGLDPVGGFYQPLSGGKLQARGAYLAAVPAAGDSARNDALEARDLSELLDAVEARALELAARLRAGELQPCPQTCGSDGCAYPSICWARA